jgi:hypothetical protein
MDGEQPDTGRTENQKEAAMGRIVVTEFVALDGVAEQPGGRRRHGRVEGEGRTSGQSSRKFWHWMKLCS